MAFHRPKGLAACGTVRRETGTLPPGDMHDFRNALDSWEISRKEADTALRGLERKNYLLMMTSGEDNDITDIVITPPAYPCPDCRLMGQQSTGLGRASPGLSASAREAAETWHPCLRGHIMHDRAVHTLECARDDHRAAHGTASAIPNERDPL